jgi:hypothetical protein
MRSKALGSWKGRLRPTLRAESRSLAGSLLRPVAERKRVWTRATARMLGPDEWTGCFGLLAAAGGGVTLGEE